MRLVHAPSSFPLSHRGASSCRPSSCTLVSPPLSNGGTFLSSPKSSPKKFLLVPYRDARFVRVSAGDTLAKNLIIRKISQAEMRIHVIFLLERFSLRAGRQVFPSLFSTREIIYRKRTTLHEILIASLSGRDKTRSGSSHDRRYQSARLWKGGVFTQRASGLRKLSSQISRPSDNSTLIIGYYQSLLQLGREIAVVGDKEISLFITDSDGASTSRWSKPSRRSVVRKPRAFIR
jgi:hypothetical protein